MVIPGYALIMANEGMNGQGDGHLDRWLRQHGCEGDKVDMFFII